jgi:endogenous inhibitor of DNA gyrase (YacG/DUF329 family)
MKLTMEQRRKFFREFDVWITEACDECGQLLGSVRWIRSGEATGFCSAVCRDGIKSDSTTEGGVSASCKNCGTSLAGKRQGAMYCSDVCRKRSKKFSTAQKDIFIAETPIQKQGLINTQNDGSTNTITRPVEAV